MRKRYPSELKKKPLREVIDKWVRIVLNVITAPIWIPLWMAIGALLAVPIGIMLWRDGKKEAKP